MEKRFDILTLGELLIDFTHNGTSNQGNGLFEANPGGAVCNVLAMMNKLGHSAAYMGKVGDDIFGHLLKKGPFRPSYHLSSFRVLVFWSLSLSTISSIHYSSASLGLKSNSASSRKSFIASRL
jgi:hypothetical protein